MIESGTWYLVLGTWYLVLGTWYLVLGLMVTTLVDIFDYTSPFGPVGHIFDFLILENYMQELLTKRNEVIKTIAESNRWKEFIDVK